MFTRVITFAFLIPYLVFIHQHIAFLPCRKLHLAPSGLASYPGSLGRGKKEPGIYCLRMRLIKIRTTREFELLRKRKMGGATMTYNNKRTYRL